MKLIAYHNDPAIKAKYLARVRAHREADQLVKGRYWEGGKGCAVGCTIHCDIHANYETELGIPRMLARIEDGIFEGLTNGDAMAWPEAFLEAIKPGSDLSRVGDRFLRWLLLDPTDGVIRFAKTKNKSLQSIVSAKYICGKSRAKSSQKRTGDPTTPPTPPTTPPTPPPPTPPTPPTPPLKANPENGIAKN